MHSLSLKQIIKAKQAVKNSLNFYTEYEKRLKLILLLEHEQN